MSDQVRDIIIVSQRVVLATYDVEAVTFVSRIDGAQGVTRCETVIYPSGDAWMRVSQRWLEETNSFGEPLVSAHTSIEEACAAALHWHGETISL